MKQVVSKNVEIAQYVDTVDHTEWEYLKKEFPDAVFDEERRKYLSLGEDFFDRSDLADLAIDIANGDVVHLEEIDFSSDYWCYYNNKTGEYIGILIPEKDRSGK